MSTFSLEIRVFIQILSITTWGKGGISNFLSEHNHHFCKTNAKKGKVVGFFLMKSTIY